MGSIIQVLIVCLLVVAALILTLVWAYYIFLKAARNEVRPVFACTFTAGGTEYEEDVIGWEELLYVRKHGVWREGADGYIAHYVLKKYKQRTEEEIQKPDLE